MELPNLRQFTRYRLDNEHDNEFGTDYADKRRIPVIYALFIDENLMYIGMSIDFWHRLKEHRLCPKKSRFTHFAIQEFEHATKEQLRIYEKVYLNHYKPMWNKIGVYETSNSSSRDSNTSILKHYSIHSSTNISLGKLLPHELGETCNKTDKKINNR